MGKNQTKPESVFEPLPLVKYLLGIPLAIVVLGLSVYGLGYLIKTYNKQETVNYQEYPVKMKVAIAPFPNALLHEIGCASITPEELWLYLESGSLLGTLSILGSQYDLNQLGEVLGQDEAVLTNLDPRFSLVQEEGMLALIFKILSREEVTSWAEDTTWPETWAPYFIGDFMVVTNAEEMADKIDSAFKKRIVSLSLNSSFQGSINHLDKEGMMFIYLPLRNKKQDFPTVLTGTSLHWDDKVTGTAFVLKEDQGTVVLIEE